MRSNSLRPHTYAALSTHARHRQWLSRFSSQERHALIGEDHEARSSVFWLMAGIWLCGLILVLVALFSA
jgi:hypothetical protein